MLKNINIDNIEQKRTMSAMYLDLQVTVIKSYAEFFLCLSFWGLIQKLKW